MIKNFTKMEKICNYNNTSIYVYRSVFKGKTGMGRGIPDKLKPKKGRRSKVDLRLGILG